MSRLTAPPDVLEDDELLAPPFDAELELELDEPLLPQAPSATAATAASSTAASDRT